MKIGLYFGSFNPIHIGHLIIANHLLNETDLERVWLVVSPQNPLKVSSSLLNEYDRLQLAKLATEDDSRLQVSDIEFKLPKPSYTVDTLTFIKEKYSQHDFSIIMGSDSFQNLPKWKNPEVIVNEYPVYVYKRPGFEIANIYSKSPIVLEAPLLQISATEIREAIRQGKSVRYMLPDKVREEIEKGRYYKS